MTYLECFGLKEPPFSKEIADADLWLPTSKQAVADGLLEALTANTCQRRQRPRADTIVEEAAKVTTRIRRRS